MSFHRSIACLLLGLVSVSAQELEAVEPAPVTPPVVPAVPVPIPVPIPVPTPVPTPTAPARPPGIPGRIPQPPGVPIPGAAVAPAAGAPVDDQPVRIPGVSLGNTPITTDIFQPKLSGTELAGLYRKYTGRRVIVSSAAATAEFAFVQEATPADPLTFAKAAELLKKAATIENFIFVPDEQDPNLDFLTLPTGGIRPTARGIATYNENSTLPEGDAVIQYVMTLSYIKPAEAVNTFTQIIGQFGAYGSIAAVPNASAVVITENTSLIRRLIELKKEIDKPGSVSGTRFIKVQYADVTEIATTLTDLLTAQQSAQKTAGIQRTDGAPPPPGGNPAAANGQPGSASSGEDTPVQIIPDPRTNRIFAMGRPVDLLFVEGLVREFDVETSEKNFLRRKLRFLTVSDFLPIASNALTRAFSSGTSGSGGAPGGAAGGAAPSGGSRSQAKPAASSSRSSGSSSGSNFGNSSSSGSSSLGGNGSSGGSSGGSSSHSSAGLSDPNANSAPESVLVGRTLLVADNITNSIVVQGPPSGLEIIERLLDQIDVKPDQVMISTVIGQVTLSNDLDTEVSYLYRDGNIKLGGGSGFPDIAPITPAAGTAGSAIRFPRFDPSALSSTGLRAFGMVGDLGIYLKALQTKSDFTVLSRPSIFTSNNQKGTISSGERIAIPTSSNSFSTGGASTNIEYQDVVLKLEVIPLVNSDNEITMQISLLADEQNGTQTIEGAGSNGTTLTVPRISTREILTTATVPNGNTVVLGGLIINRNSKTKSGIPILSDIPYLGRLFSSTIDNKDRSELMVFIQPSIVRSDRSLDAVQADMDSRYQVSGKARTFADGPGVLPPTGAITPVTDKETSHGNKATSRSQAVAPPARTTSTMKDSIRPANRK